MPGLVKRGIVRRVWAGELSLVRMALTFVFVTGPVVLWFDSIELVRSSVKSGFGFSDMHTSVSYLWLIFVTFMLFPWVAIGLLRTAEKHVSGNDPKWVLTLVQFTLPVSICLVISQGITSVQKLTDERYGVQFNNIPTLYQLKVDPSGQVLLISGVFDFGLVNEVEMVLQSNPKIQTVQLASQGGNVYEGRGLSKLIGKQLLNTRVESECSSACTTAFIGGIERRLGAGAKLGFHRYGVQGSELQRSAIFHRPSDEEKRDMELFRRQNVSEVFLEKAYSTEHQNIYYPDKDELYGAGVLTHRGD